MEKFILVMVNFQNILGDLDLQEYQSNDELLDLYETDNGILNLKKDIPLSIAQTKK